DDRRAQVAHQLHGLFDRVTATDDVVDDDARIDLALVDVLAKHALAVFLFGPVNLFCAQRVAHAESDRDAAGTWTDDRNLWQLTGDVALNAKFAAESHGQNSRGVVIAKGERHLKIVRRVFAVWIDEVTFAKRAGAPK